MISEDEGATWSDPRVALIERGYGWGGHVFTHEAGCETGAVLPSNKSLPSQSRIDGV